MNGVRLLVIAGIALTACRGAAPTMPAVVDARPFVSGDAAANLSATGQFVLRESPPGELTEVQAKALAAAYTRGGAPWLGATWEHDRHDSIDFDKLTVCPRAYYANSVFDLSNRGSKSLRERLGGQWIVTMCAPGGAPMLSIAISALATYMHVVGGELVSPGGGQFRAMGIPTSFSSVPITPESAVKIAAQAAGVSVTRVPELVLPPSSYVPQLAKWRIRLASPITLRGVETGLVRTTDEIYVGFGATWNSVEIQLPDTTVAQRSFTDHEAGGVTVSLPVLAGYPVAFEIATVVRP
jgi:hypothetical protein